VELGALETVSEFDELDTIMIEELGNGSELELNELGNAEELDRPAEISHMISYTASGPIVFIANALAKVGPGNPKDKVHTRVAGLYP
jgi:hypothetical protein